LLLPNRYRAYSIQTEQLFSLEFWYLKRVSCFLVASILEELVGFVRQYIYHFPNIYSTTGKWI
jgi:hypothetical protein